MKDRKKIMCSGLAFDDKEDMEMLHEYALEGWVFREFKGLSYILYKEEPQDLIFSYDIYNPKNIDEEYYEFFRNAGWEPIKQKRDSVQFFSAKNGTVPVHTDANIQADSFKNITKWSLITFLISMLLFIVTIKSDIFKDIHFWLNKVILISSAGLMGGSGMCFIGCFLRTHKKRLAFNLSMKTTIVLLIGCLGIFLAMIYYPFEATGLSKLIISILKGASLGGILSCLICLYFKYPLYRDGKIK